MHLLIKDESGKQVACLCFERGGTSQILFFIPELLASLLNVAKALGMPRVYMIADAGDIEALEARGFRVADEKLYVKEL